MSAEAESVQATSEMSPDELAALIASIRERYRSDVAAGLDRFFEPPRTTCPWCESPRIRHLLNSADIMQSKPGHFSVMSCRTCGHAFQNPRLSLAGLEYYYRDFYDGVGAEAVEKGFEFGTGANLDRARHLKEFFPGAAPARWVDVGTGYGHFCRDARTIWPDTRFEGLDMGGSVEEGKSRGWLDEAHRGFLPDLAPSLAGQFDVVSMHHYLEHTREPRVELDSAARLLKDGGILMIEVPNPESLFGRLVGRWWMPWLQPQHLNFVTRANLMQALAHRGLRPVLEVRGAAHIPVDFTFLAVLPLLAYGPYPSWPWFADPGDPVRKKRFDAAMKLGPTLHKVAMPLDRVRTKVAHITDRGNTYRVLARKQS